MKRLFLLVALCGLLCAGCDEILLGTDDPAQDPIENPGNDEGGDDEGGDVGNEDNTGNDNNNDEGEKEEDSPVFSIDSNGRYVVEAKGGEVVVKVTTNIDYSVIIPKKAQSWLSVATTRAELREENLVFVVAENTTSEERNTTVQVVDNDYNVVQAIDIEQSAKSAEVGEIKLTADSTTITLGEAVTFVAKRRNVETGEFEDVTKDVIFIDSKLGEIFNPFVPTAEGSYTVSCTYDYSYYSNSVVITVLPDGLALPADPDPSCLVFNHRTLLVDHTGVNCGYCPQMTDRLIELAATDYHNHYNEVTCHGNGGNLTSGDPANSAAAEIVGQYYAGQWGSFGFPTVCINFATAKYSNSSNVLNNIKNALKDCIKYDGADAGIAMAVEGDASAIKCVAQIKAKVAQEYKAVAWLLESGIYSPNQSGASKDVHRIYNYAVRNVSGQYTKSNISGESVGVISAGATHNCTFELPILSTKWNWENMGVLVIVSAKNSNGVWEVVNTAYCSINDRAKGYEYIK